MAADISMMASKLADWPSRIRRLVIRRTSGGGRQTRAASARASSSSVSAGTTYIASHAKAARELQWTPRPLREGLAQTFASMRPAG